MVQDHGYADSGWALHPKKYFYDQLRQRKKDSSEYHALKSKDDLSHITVPTISTLGVSAREVYKELLWFLGNKISVSILEIPGTLNLEYIIPINQAITDLYKVLAYREHIK